VEGEHWVTVKVSTDLLAGLREWSRPVQAQVVETPGHGTGYELTFREVQPVTAVVSWGQDGSELTLDGKPIRQAWAPPATAGQLQLLVYVGISEEVMADAELQSHLAEITADHLRDRIHEAIASYAPVVSDD
jgi:hypothetical protein